MLGCVPRLWNDTIDAHRRDVTDAILDTTVALVDRNGVRAVTMSEIAEQVGIGRATLYKYFPSVEAILTAWHHRQVGAHLAELNDVAQRPGSANDRLREGLSHYAMILHQNHGGELAALLHQADHVDRAHDELHRLMTQMISDAAASGEVRTDVTPRELATYCIHALDAAGELPSKAAVQRLVVVITDALRRAT